jgi:hypothetical protein
MLFYKNAIQNNHEFLADQEVLTDYQQENYQHTLFNQWLKTTIFPRQILPHGKQKKRFGIHSYPGIMRQMPNQHHFL